MRLIIKEYVSQLIEKDELDILLEELFAQKGYIADSYPKTGNRQFGVDIQLHNKTELLLLVVKRGNLDRNTWDGDINAVRQSLDEIKDVTMNLLTYDEKGKNIRVIVATNGYMDEAVKPNWKGYVNNNREWSGYPVEISFMGIDEIVGDIQENIFSEQLFPVNMRSLLRKALYFIDEGGYKKSFYERIVDETISKIKEAIRKNKKFQKASTTLYLASQMICQYAQQAGILKVAVSVSEYVIIRYWKMLYNANLFEKEQSINWLIKFCKCYERWNELYLEKIDRIAKKEAKLPNYNPVENRVLLYEIMGKLASYGNYLLNIDETRAGYVVNCIVALINEYDYFVYAPYDNSIGTLIMIYKLLYHFGRKDELIYLIKYQTDVLMRQYLIYKRYPAPSDTFEEAMAIEMDSKDLTYEMSGCWGYFLLILYYLNEDSIYNRLNDFLKTKLGTVSKCIWFLRGNEEMLFYDSWAMNTSGEGVDVTIEDSFEKFVEKMSVIVSNYENEMFSFEKYCFEALEMIICDYYGYIPRVSFLNDKDSK